MSFNLMEGIQTRINKDSIDKVMNTLSVSIAHISNIRILVSAFLVTWLLGITYLAIRKDKDNPEGSTKYYNLHRIWFGDESVVLALWRIWYYVILLMALGPIVKELVIAWKIKSAF